jgi:hypothetical protein
METLRLRKIQQPSHLERLLEAYISRGKFLPSGAYQIRDPGAVPGALRRIAAKAAEEGHVWACWVDNFHSWLFICEMSLSLSRERGSPVLSVSRYDEAGDLIEAGMWAADRDGRWLKCAD